MEFFSKYRHLSWVLLLIPIYVLLFVRLGAFHIRLWDEGWFVVHVYEMMERGSMLVPYYDGEAVFYGSKPPVQTWLQMIFVKLIGYNELAVRLPSAIAAGLTVLLIFQWVKKYATEAMAWIAALALLTMDGFVDFHAARGAEADALLTLTIIAQVYFFWEWVVHDRKKDLMALAAMIALSFWVKNIAGFMMLPGFLIYAVLYERSRLMEMLKRKETYLWLGGGIALGLSYLLVREIAQPGHLEFILDRQAGRLVNDVGHDQPFRYYYDHLINEKMHFYLPLAVFSLLFVFLRTDEDARPFKLAAVLTILYFLLVSSARSKLVWYVMPLYPLSAVVMAYPIGLLLQDLRAWKQMAFVILVFALPLQAMFAKTQENTIDEWSKFYEMEEQYLFDAYNQGKNLEGLNVIHDHFDGALLFYKYKFKDAGQHINLQNNIDLEAGQQALVNSDKMKAALSEAYELDTLDQLHNALVVKVLGPKLAVENDSLSTEPVELETE